MHELSIATAVLKAVRVEAARRHASRVRTVGLRVGELAGVDGESLRFCLEALARDTELAGVTLDITLTPRRQHCHACGRAFDVEVDRTACPACGRPDTTCVGGDELELAFLELEDT